MYYRLKKNSKPEIYLISPEHIEVKKFAKLLEKILSLGIVKIFQLRLKKCPVDYLHICIEILFSICKKYKVLFILNDNPELVKKYNLNGVHVGESDLPLSACREIIGKNKILGKSCYNSNDLAIRAQKKGVDYIAYGAFFKTTTKEVIKYIDLKNFSKIIKNVYLPTVGIGGINKDNFVKIKNINLDYVAISSGVWNDTLDPITAIKKMKNLIDNC